MKDHENRAIDFGRRADDYDRFRPGFPDGFLGRLERDRWIEAGQRALDLGTGTGTLALGFAARGLKVTGIDIAPELLDVARGRARNQDLSVRFVQGRAEATGQDGASFDVVSAGQCWWWFDSDAALSEAVRVLAPNGRLIICSFNYLPLPDTVALSTEDLILKHNPGWSKGGWRGVHPEHVEALDRGGFQQVESFSYVVDVSFTHEAWRGRVRTSNGVGSSLNTAEVERFDTELADILDCDFSGSLTVPHRVFAATGIRPVHPERP